MPLCGVHHAAPSSYFDMFPRQPLPLLLSLTLTLSLSLSLTLTLALTMTSGDARAARPLVTDDARSVDTDGCQIESYVKRQRSLGERELWFLPACNPGGYAELTLGGTRTDNNESGRSSSTIAQAKFLLQPLKTNVQGRLRRPGSARSRSPCSRREWASSPGNPRRSTRSSP